ncbi:hypothetical protein M0R45_031374 [Rubus argutus]|uniref:Toll-like receptor 3 n=1 Tax=Rubus argutus TaxID=59490 RepID=A0AAW1WHZ8_RUBAR
MLKVLDLSKNCSFRENSKEIGNCPNLWTLNLYNNQFTGELPLFWTNTSLINLDVEFNLLSGELPVKLVENLPAILYLHLSNNNMVSHDGNTNLNPFFTALANCTRLLELDWLVWDLEACYLLHWRDLVSTLQSVAARKNQIFGSGSFKCRGNLTKLNYLFLNNKPVIWTNTSSIRTLHRTVQLDLSHKQIDRGHSPELSSGLSEIRLFINLSHNQLEGSIPIERSKLEDVQENGSLIK